MKYRDVSKPKVKKPKLKQIHRVVIESDDIEVIEMILSNLKYMYVDYEADELDLKINKIVDNLNIKTIQRI